MAHDVKSRILGLVYVLLTPFAAVVAQEQTAFQRIIAADGTFSVDIPLGWRPLLQPTFYGFISASDMGESFSSGLVSVYTNALMLQSTLRGFQLAGVPQPQLNLMARLLSAPLTTEGVIGQLLPQVGGRAIAQLQIMSSRPISTAPGTQLSLIHYQYVLLPRQDPTYAAVYHPALLARDQVPMEGVAAIWILSPASNAFSWSFLGETVEAPRPIFRRHGASYARIFNSFQYIPQGLALLIKTNADWQRIANDMNETNRLIGQGWWETLGPLTHFVDPSDRGWQGEGYPTPFGSRTYHCRNESNDPVQWPASQPPPYPDCVPVEP